MLPRGIRSNNPGNIRESSTDKTQWGGERATDDDPVFEEFETPQHGIRAMTRILMTYQNRYDLMTVSEMMAASFLPMTHLYLPASSSLGSRILSVEIPSKSLTSAE